MKRSKKPNYIQKREAAEQHARERQYHQGYINAINSLTDQLKTGQDKQDAHEKKRAFREKLTIALVGATLSVGVVTAIIFFCQLLVFDKTDRTLNNTLVASNRAWMAPRRMVFDTIPVEGKQISTLMIYENIGKTPAFNFVVYVPDVSFPDAGIFTVNRPDSEVVEKAIGENRTYEGRPKLLPNKGGATVYPGWFDRPPRILLENIGIADPFIMKKEKTILIKGCASYRTYEIQEQTPFCFLLYPSEADPWRFVLCGVGPDPT